MIFKSTTDFYNEQDISNLSARKYAYEISVIEAYTYKKDSQRKTEHVPKIKHRIFLLKK